MVRRCYLVSVNEPESKTCPLCCEPVHPAARKCPHCQHYLNKWTLLANHPLVAISPMFVALAVGAVMLEGMFAPGKSFDSYRSQVRVTHSELQFGELRAGPTVAVVGTMQNESNIAWKTVTLEVQFFDKSGKTCRHEAIEAVE